MRSLTLRLVLLSGLWVGAGLALCGWFVTGLATGHIEAAADARLQALLDSVLAAAGSDANGKPLLTRAISEPEFDRPLSGLYWQLTSTAGSAASRSLWDAALPGPAVLEAGAQQAADVIGPRQDRLRLLTRVVELPGMPGPMAVQVAASRAGTDATLAALRRVLLLAFAGLGSGLVLGLVAALLFGLRPLHAARLALADVRAGTRESLDLPAPREIAPLVQEINALIRQNRTTVERARAHLGNLAHALKTPVAVLRNALSSTPPDLAQAQRQAQAVQHIVQHHLARARSMALQSPADAAAPLAIAQELASALQRLHAAPARGITITGDATLRVRADRQDLMEMIGNLMENACRWAGGSVAVRVHGDADMVSIDVEDDGPGLPEEARATVLDRGIRFDEADAGSGLGLAITADLARLLEGRLQLDRGAALGGLRARLVLPRLANRL